MPRRKTGSDPPTPEALREQMLRGVKAETVPVFDACGEKLAERGEWDAISMRDVREACLLMDAVTGYRTSCAHALRDGDGRLARQYMQAMKETLGAQEEILRRWDLLPQKKRGRPAQETPKDLAEAPEDDGWDTFGADTEG